MNKLAQRIEHKKRLAVRAESAALRKAERATEVGAEMERQRAAAAARRLAKRQQTIDLGLQVQERWPAIFNRTSPLPLAIGVFHEIVAEFPDSKEFVCPFLAYWTSRRPYLRATATGDVRYHLDGTTESLSEDSREWARKKLERRKKVTS